jgi:hypothetical protein
MHAVTAFFRIACLAMLLCVGRSFFTKVWSRGVAYHIPLQTHTSAGMLTTPASSRAARRSRLLQSRDSEPTTLPPSYEDMQHLAMVLANMTDSLDSAPDVAMSIVSQQLGWLYARNVPK